MAYNDLLRKKLASLLLALAMSATLATPAFAVAATQQPEQQTATTSTEEQNETTDENTEAETEDAQEDESGDNEADTESEVPEISEHSAVISIPVNVTVSGIGMEPKTFTVTAEPDKDNPEGATVLGDVSFDILMGNNVTSTKNMRIAFDTYNQEAVSYSFDLKEVLPDGADSGMAVDDVEWDITKHTLTVQVRYDAAQGKDVIAAWFVSHGGFETEGVRETDIMDADTGKDLTRTSTVNFTNTAHNETGILQVSETVMPVTKNVDNKKANAAFKIVLDGDGLEDEYPCAYTNKDVYRNTLAQSNTTVKIETEANKDTGVQEKVIHTVLGDGDSIMIFGLPEGTMYDVQSEDKAGCETKAVAGTSGTIQSTSMTEGNKVLFVSSIDESYKAALIYQLPESGHIEFTSPRVLLTYLYIELSSINILFLITMAVTVIAFVVICHIFRYHGDEYWV